MTTRTNRFRFDDVEQGILLLVEGIDDARFFDAFLRSIPKVDVQVAAVGGRDGFRRILVETLLRADNLSSLHSLGVARDADTNATDAFRSVRDALAAAGLPAPAQPFENQESEGLIVSVAILPDGTSQGSLEDLCLLSMQGQEQMVCIEQYMACLAQAGIAARQPSKARLHAYLAAGDEPGLRIGEAADAGVWDWNSGAFNQLAEFLRAL